MSSSAPSAWSSVMKVHVSARASLPFLLLWASIPPVWAARKDITPDDIPFIMNPYLDPSRDLLNPLRYITSNVLTGIAVALVLIVGVVQTWFIRKWGGMWMSSMTIGAYFFAMGLAFRFGLHFHPHSQGIYICEYLFVVLAPCAFIAADYVLLGRLAQHLDADEYLLIPSRRITTIFIASDITTFLIQASGGSLSASAKNSEQAFKGSRVFFGGLIVQLVSFSCFSVIYGVFLYRIWRHNPRIWGRDKEKTWYESWKALAAALVISCVGILVRSVFRVIELSEGFDGPITRSEPLFYGLDTLPLFVAITVYIPFWPGRFIRRGAAAERDEKASSGSR